MHSQASSSSRFFAVMDAPHRAGVHLNPLVTVSTQCILAFRASYPSINAIQTRLYPAGRAGGRREHALPSVLKTLRSKAKVERDLFRVPGLSSPWSDLPRFLLVCTLAHLLSLRLRFPEYPRCRLSSLSPPLSLSLSPSCVMTDRLRLVRANRYSLYKATIARHYVKNSSFRKQTEISLKCH